MANHANMRLGRKHVRIDPRTLRLARYVNRAALPPAPVSVDWTKGITNWGMMLNDQLGDCTIAGAAHAIQVWSANLGTELTVSDADVEKAYELWDGYDPANPEATDQGGVELDVLNKWRQNTLAGHGLLGYADPDVSDLEEVRMAISLFGGVYIGLNLPLTAQDQDMWDVDTNGQDQLKRAPGSWGGHCVFVCGYDAASFTCLTWGAPKKMTVRFWVAYCDEAHALFGSDWLGANQVSPGGLDRGQLLQDLQQVTT